MVSMGLARAATRRSLGVQTFKKGPDYIDPLWLKAASYNPCYNLDPYLQSDKELHSLYYNNPNDVVIVEGTMGLHDGLAVDGSDSNAAVAKRLALPVLLVIDCRGMHRTIASLVNGIMQFDPDLSFSGLILNRIRSSRHASKIEHAVNEYCDVSVVGVIPEQPSLHIDERELGLVPAPDHPTANNYIDTVADTLESSCNLDKLLLHNTISDHSLTKNTVVEESPCSLTIGIAKDEAFHFYYEDDLEKLRSRGVRLVPFSPIHDRLPADLDGVLIGGGFPERHAAALSQNQTCREDLAKRISDGLPVRAECGGLMYLSQSIKTDNVVWPMVGALSGAVTMQASPQGRGYMKLKFNLEHPYANTSSNTLPAHEFHHSKITFDTAPACVYQVERGHGIDGRHDGACIHNVVASYAHFRHTEATPWIDWFLDSIQRAKQAPHKKANHV